ncbi:hypothetical protein QL285_039409 [Trifolium repens]|nr:hypothetical protein QL285_039409 [Trifolium repens]
MLQLLFAVAFSAVPLTLYIPPIRSFNLFVHTIQLFLRDSTLFSVRTFPRIRLALSRIFNSILHITWLDLVVGFSMWLFPC